MIGLLVLVLIAAVLVYLAATFIPPPIGWIIAAVIIILALVAIFGAGVDATMMSPQAKFWG